MNEVWELIDYATGDNFYFCSEICANDYADSNNMDFDAPQQVEEAYILAEIHDDKCRCDFCNAPL